MKTKLTKKRGRGELNPYFAVFNGHINNASDRAFNIVKEMMPGNCNELLELTRMRKDGIMEIFTHEPTFASSAYIGLVYYFVNQNRK